MTTHSEWLEAIYVALLLIIGISGLTAMLYTSLDEVNSGRPRGQGGTVEPQ